MRRHAVSLMIAAFASVLALPAQGHHSGAMFDHTRTVTLEGNVKEFQYTNPHSWLMVVVVGPDGQEVEWAFETEGPSSLKRAGIQAGTFRPGAKVTVVAYPMRDGRRAGAWVSATMADGVRYDLSNPIDPKKTGPAGR